MSLADDDRVRTGTVWTATAHVVTAVIGSGVLALPWSVAQMGWVLGPLALVFFAFVTSYTANLLADCYRAPDPVDGRRNYSYSDTVRAFLGRRNVLACGIIQYCILWGTSLGYTITAAISMTAIRRTHCIHREGRNADCSFSSISFTLLFGLLQCLLSQFPNLEKITVLSYIAATMSFLYSFIGLLLSTVALVNHHEVKGSLLGNRMGSHGGVVATPLRLWSSFQALGNIAFAFTYAMVLIEIQDTLKSPPAENKTMKRASKYGLGVTTVFYTALGCIGFAAFGNNPPGNLLTGFYEPFWLLDMANLAVVIHMIGAYQVFAQPLYAFYEEWLARRWPGVGFFTVTLSVPIPFSKSKVYRATPCKLVLRTILVAVTTCIAAVLPFFNAIVGLLGAVGFWPLTVYYPVSMHVAQAKVKAWTPKWVALQLMVCVCLIVSLLACVGSVTDIGRRLMQGKLF